MSDFFELLLSNRLYLIAAVSMAGILVFFIIKKMMKLIVLAVVILIAFLVYVYAAGDSEEISGDPVEKIVKEIK
ncbi:MAG: hypothetical protein JXA06_10525 [Bacteroidetes bacterium]|nr:hypothetical protein [Bacteroidota bacterium]